MGLDATVMCNCFRDRKTSPPPFPREWLEVDDEGYINLKKEHDSKDNWGRQYEWEQSCCDHEGMKFESQHISNWTCYRQFQEALAQVGWNNFPVLKEQLPNANGGLTPSLESTKALEELNLFAAAGEIELKTVLVNSVTGEGLYEYVASYGGIFIYAGDRGVNVGLNTNEFFAIDRNSGEVLFHATHFRQSLRSGNQVSGDSEDIVWECLDTGQLYGAGIAISGKQIPWEDGSWQKPNGQCRFEYPSEFHVEQRPQLSTDFDYIVKALQAVFEASSKTGNPVRWC